MTKTIRALLLIFFMALLPSMLSANSLVVGTSYTTTTGNVVVPLSLSGNTNAVGAITVNIQYDSALVSIAKADVYAGADANAAGWTLSPSISPPSQGGLATIALSAFSLTTPISSVTAIIAELHFNVLHTAADIPIIIDPAATHIFDSTQTDIYAQYTLTDGVIIIGTAPVTADITPPVVTPPADLIITTLDPYVLDTYASVVTFLAGATATDLVAGVVQASPYNAPTQYPIGITTVEFQATDAYGNIGSATATVTVLDANAAPVPVVNIGSNVANPARVAITALLISGTANNNALVNVTMTSATGAATALAQVTASAVGVWSIPNTDAALLALADSVYAVTATQTASILGIPKISAASPAKNLIIDTIAAAPNIIISNNVTSPAIDMIDAAAATHTLVASNTPLISGTAEANALISISDAVGNTRLGAARTITAVANTAGI
ncbi:MAG: cohesin domain-containing protein, partial [Mariprofundales bacterium]